MINHVEKGPWWRVQLIIYSGLEVVFDGFVNQQSFSATKIYVNVLPRTAHKNTKFQLGKLAYYGSDFERAYNEILRFTQREVCILPEKIMVFLENERQLKENLPRYDESEAKHQTDRARRLYIEREHSRMTQFLTRKESDAQV